MLKKKILVTGGAGFIGSHLCERLSKKTEIEVFSLDNYFTGSKKNHVPNVTYINGNTSEISSLVNFKPDLVYHLGEYSRVEQSFEDVATVMQFNQIGTLAVLEFVRKSGCKILYAGSSTKFGDNGLSRSSSPYSWSKASNTELVKNYGAWFNISYAITYFYNVYGGREISDGKYATLIALWAEKMRNNKSLTVVSPGNQKRNFTHIDDIINGLILVGDTGHGDEFGIGSPESYSIKELAEIYGGTIEMIPKRSGNRMSADVIDKKTRALGWEPKYKLVNYIDNLRLNNWIQS